MEKKASGSLVTGELVSRDPGVDKAPVREAGLMGWSPTSPLGLSTHCEDQLCLSTRLP